MVIGRQPGLDVTLENAAVSRRHARLTWEGGQVFVEDLGSSNGTFLNEVRIARKSAVQPGDSLRLGGSVLRLENPPPVDPEMTIQRQTVAATSNAELFRDNASAKLQAVLQLAHHLGHSPDTDTVLNRLLDQLLVLFPHGDRALVLLREGDEPRVRAHRQRGGQTATGPLFSQSVLRKVFTQAMGVLAEDTRHGQTYLSAATLGATGTQSLVCVPMLAQGGRVFGALQLDRFQMGRPFTSDDLYLLASVALMVAPVLENAELHQELLANERMQRDLAMAREIQLGYLPRDPVQMAGGAVELVAELHPALEVSGDFFDYFPLDDRRLVLLVADVSGKGMSAALFMTMVHALARHLAQAAVGPADLLARLNDAIAQDNPNFLFVTVACGFYDVATGTLTLAYGGHPPALLRRRDGVVAEVTNRGAPLLGMQRDIRRAEESVLQLAPGDGIVIYTDGVTESPGLNRPDDLFGVNRLLDLLRGLPADAPPAAWTSAVREGVEQHSGPASAADDITVVALRRPVESAA